MKGTIENYKGSLGCAWIRGEDDKIYFTHEHDCLNSKKLPKGSIVEFEVQEAQDWETHDRAVSVKKLGLGSRHPFAMDAERVVEFLKSVEQSEERDYRIRDMQVIAEYFRHCEDFEWCRTPREVFRAKLQVKMEDGQ